MPNPRANSAQRIATTTQPKTPIAARCRMVREMRSGGRVGAAGALGELLILLR
ncbi:hypothetical protein GCM10009805_11110 [Leucobacter chromiireducens subsp. solipictus]